MWSNGTVVGISLILMTLTTTFIVWPLSNAFYLITDKYLIINYFRPGKISFADFESAEKVGGKHKYALTGFGYYCTNFKDRVLIRVRGKGKTKEYVLSPPNPDEFVELLNRNKAIYRRMYQEKES
ncbi:hypothetical protein DRN74_03345 [Candidatus Micrarchaeota archaeon]|nr:MAG: hypothetical protein DRN74_03345 [Candidatus Micrarchaeota archaeon]